MKPAALTTVGDSGTWKVFASAPGLGRVDVSWVREAPVQVAQWTDSDPFGLQSVTLVFSGLTIFDRLGKDDLWWATKHVDFDVVYTGPIPAGYPYPGFALEGFSESFDYTSDGVSITVKGFFYQLDNYLAKPEYTPSPLPYEYAIARQWHARPDLRMSPLMVVFPDWWETVYTPVPRLPGYRIPQGVAAGERWTGLLTRSTGSWDPVLTSYIQTLLGAMYTARGRWTLATSPGRKVTLLHRDIVFEPDAATIVCDIADPGVDPKLNEDWSQSLNVVYGQGKDLQGSAYSGMLVSADGNITSYQPLAAMRQVEPITDINGWFEPHRMRKEVQIQLAVGLEEVEARKVGQAHLQHFSSPGLTGTITLTADVRMSGGELLPRALIRAGMSIQLKGVFGSPEGVMFHIVTASMSDNGTMALTVDSKFRDQLTVDEVRLRGRDALSVTRQLIGGLYEPPIPDQLVPWNYAEGSGYIPSSSDRSAKRLFDGMPVDIDFPWQDWTVAHPPSNPAYKDAYVRIGPASATDSNQNWALNPTRDASLGSGFGYGFPIRLAQQGTIRLLQLAAYDKDGNVLAVPFHFSIYYVRSVNVQSMPRIPNAQTGKWGPVVPPGFVVDDAHRQHYPFHDNAWERFNADGTARGIDVSVATESAGLIRGWGTGPAKAGYWPGSSAAGDAPTGLLLDEGTFEFNPFTDPNAANYINPYSTIQNMSERGNVYGMIYCDAQGDQDVYFTGRFWRVEPGTSV